MALLLVASREQTPRLPTNNIYRKMNTAINYHTHVRHQLCLNKKIHITDFTHHACNSHFVSQYNSFHDWLIFFELHRCRILFFSGRGFEWKIWKKNKLWNEKAFMEWILFTVVRYFSLRIKCEQPPYTHKHKIHIKKHEKWLVSVWSLFYLAVQKPERIASNST